MSFDHYITITPGIRNGKPYLTGTRITVYDVLNYLAGGMTEPELIEEFPTLRTEHVRAVQAFAADLL